MREFMKKVTLLLLPMPSSMMVALLSASMLQIYAAYPQYSESIVTMVLTIPNLTVMIGLVLAPVLLKRFAIKKLLMAGSGLFVISSVLPVWCTDFYVLLFLRALSGVGCGMILPLQATFLATYPEKERAALMGLSATIGCLIAAFFVAVSGIVAADNWRNVFLLYLVTAVALVLTVLFLPEHLESVDENSSISLQGQAGEAAEKLSSYGNVLFAYYFLMIGCYLFISVLGSQIAPYLEYVNLGGSAESGLMMSISLIGSMLAGLILGQYIQLTKGLSMAGVFLGSAVSFVLLWIAPSLVFVGIAAFLNGFFSAMVACVINYEMSRALPLSLFTTAAAGLNFFTFVLQFVGPFLFLTILELVPSGSFRMVCMIYAAVHFAFIFIAYLLQNVVLKPKKEAKA